MVAKNTSKLVILRHFKFRLEQIPAVEQIPAQDQNDRAGICRNLGTWLLEPIRTIAKSKFQDFRSFSKILPLTKSERGYRKTGKFLRLVFFRRTYA
jgi:hypothetical protein